MKLNRRVVQLGRNSGLEEMDAKEAAVQLAQCSASGFRSDADVQSERRRSELLSGPLRGRCTSQ